MKDEQCIEVEAGTPTLTVELESEARMIPWNSFVSGIFVEDRITLNFSDWLITIDGERLEELWSGLQLQDVRVMRSATNGDQHECLIRDLSMQEVTGV